MFSQLIERLISSVLLLLLPDLNQEKRRGKINLETKYNTI